jgi:photosystem II stability/assembly factor-like uncharacterized protein
VHGPYRLYAGTQSGLSILRGVGDIWTFVNQPRFQEPHFAGKVVDSVAGCRTTPEVVYAGVTFDGLYRTRNAGRRWERVLEGDIRWVSVDPTDDRVVYAGTEPVHLYRSEDGGDTWEEVRGLQDLPPAVKEQWWFPTPPHQGHVRHILVDETDPACLYLCLEHGGIVRTFDRGQTWEDVSEGIEYPDIHMIAKSPGTPGKYFVATSRGFFEADPPEAGWKRAERGIRADYFHDLVTLPGDPAAMFLATGHGSPQYWDRLGGAEGRIYRSEDDGQTWRQVGAGLPKDHKAMCWQLARNPYDPNSLFAAFGDVPRGHTAGAEGEGAIYVTYDRGDSWEEVGHQKRSVLAGSGGYTSLPAIRVLWAAVDD